MCKLYLSSCVLDVDNETARPLLFVVIRVSRVGYSYVLFQTENLFFFFKKYQLSNLQNSESRERGGASQIKICYLL